MPSVRDLQCFSRVFPTSRVGRHPGKPRESVVYCLNKQFYQQRHRNNDYSKTRTVLSDPRITDLADRHGHLPKMVPQLLALINLPLCEAGFSDKQALSVNPLTALVSCATEFTST